MDIKDQIVSELQKKAKKISEEVYPSIVELCSGDENFYKPGEMMLVLVLLCSFFIEDCQKNESPQECHNTLETFKEVLECPFKAYTLASVQGEA